MQPDRKWSLGSYRYGFNGKENDNEVKGEGNQQDYGFRIYDPRIGKFLSVDPLTPKYPELTPYQFASNRPIDGIDLDGAEHKRVVHWYDGLNKDGSPKIVKTAVDIKKNVIFISKVTGMRYAQTEVYYINKADGSVKEGQSLYERIDEDHPKPSANYDYTQNEIPEKSKEDGQWIDDQVLKGNYTAHWQTISRDLDAPDNALVKEDLGGVEAAMAATPYSLQGMRFFGKWESESTEGWSLFSKRYQKQISGVEPGQTLVRNGVKFDGFRGNTLLEAKGKYAFLLRKGWAQEGLLDQARRQVRAANGLRIEWHFAEEEAANTVRTLFRDQGINIDVYHTPYVTP